MNSSSHLRLSVVVGVLVGLPIGLSRFAQRTTLPLILLIYSIPQVTILPLFVLYFGIGAGSKIAFGFSHGVFFIILNVIAGVQSVEEVHLNAARAMGATRMQIHPPRRAAAHDAKPVRRLAACHVRNAAGCHPGRALCLAPAASATTAAYSQTASIRLRLLRWSRAWR